MFGAFLVFVSATMTLIAYFLPLYQKTMYTTFGFSTVMRARVYTTVVVFDQFGREFCHATEMMNHFIGRPNYFACDYGPGSRAQEDLMDLNQRICQDVGQMLLRNACEGVAFAQPMGLFLLIFIIINCIAQAFSIFLLFTYEFNTPKEHYRQLSGMTLAVAAFVYALILLFFVFLVFITLDSITVPFFGGLALSIPQIWGASYGFYLHVVAAFCQMAAAPMILSSRSSREERYADAREQRKYLQDIEMMGQAGVHMAAYQHNFIQGATRDSLPWRSGMQASSQVVQVQPISSPGDVPATHERNRAERNEASEVEVYIPCLVVRCLGFLVLLALLLITGAYTY